MQQFRPLPRFDEIEEAESAEEQPGATTGEFPAFTERLIVVIHTDPKHKKSAQNMHTPARHMHLRRRHSLVFITILVILIAVLTTLGIQSHSADLSSINLTAGLPSMTIPNSPYVAVAEQDAIDAGISPVYFARQINQESNFNPKAVSNANAQGIAQFMPATAAPLGINPWDPDQALRGAAQLMASYTHQYGGDYAKALAAYNAGPGGLQSAVNTCGANWLHCVPAQTSDYIYRIMGIR